MVLDRVCSRNLLRQKTSWWARLYSINLKSGFGIMYGHITNVSKDKFYSSYFCTFPSLNNCIIPRSACFNWIFFWGNQIEFLNHLNFRIPFSFSVVELVQEKSWDLLKALFNTTQFKHLFSTFNLYWKSYG